MRNFTSKITWITVFSIAMGFMETAIVIYLRKLYYPAGFSFPLIPVSPDIALIEFLREAATIIMLVGIGILSGKTTSQKFAFFIYSFAIWDLVYYVFLKVFLDWPTSFLTWDILFLIPCPWVGPVLAPCIIAVTMIVLAALVIYAVEKGRPAKISVVEWMFFITGSLVVITSFIAPYYDYLEQQNANMWTLSSKKSLFEEIKSFVPTSYNWFLFALGEGIILAGIFLYAFPPFKYKTYDTTIKAR